MKLPLHLRRSNGRMVAIGCLGACVACTSSPFRTQVCRMEPLGDLAASEVGAVGVSPADVLDGVDGTVIEAHIVPDNDALGPQDVFDTTIAVHVTPTSSAWEDQVDGNRADPEHHPPYMLPCPTGPLLTIPVRLDVEFGVGGTASGDAWIMAMADDPSATWLRSDGLEVVDAPAWFLEMADRARCTDPSGTMHVRFVAFGSYLYADSSWETPRGSFEIQGRDATRQCATRFLEWSASAEP